MKRCGIIMLAGLAMMIMSGCTAKLKQPEWKYEKEAVRVHIQADHQLNLYNRKAHTLERAKYFAIVTGYFDKLDDARMVRRHKIQVLKKRESFWKRKYRCIPCTLEIDMALGPKQIEYSKIIIKDKACSDECK
ncbi:MAG: hypothetical protein P8X96_23520 [Desulfobacteraceae bacterium]